MKRILSLVLVALSLLLFTTGCGEKDRILYKNAKLSKFVELANYKGIKVDTASDEFKKMYDDVIAGDVKDYDLYVKKTSGKVADGDTVNIDYEGKKDGVAFDGGTAQGYDLTIGSNSFIDGFEEGLIGVEIGSTVDLNLTFPENYQSTDLAGKAVVFTVKVNSAKSTEARKPEDYYKEINFSSLKAYEDDVKDRAIKGHLLDTVIDKSTVKDYPKEDVEILKTELTKMLEKNLSSYYGMTLEAYISQTGMTQESFDKTLLEEQVYPLMGEQMALYAILDEEKVKISTADVEKKINEMVKEIGGDVTAKDVKEYYGEYYFENMLVSDKAAEIIKEYSEIK